MYYYKYTLEFIEDSTTIVLFAYSDTHYRVNVEEGMDEKEKFNLDDPWQTDVHGIEEFYDRVFQENIDVHCEEISETEFLKSTSHETIDLK